MKGPAKCYRAGFQLAPRAISPSTFITSPSVSIIALSCATEGDRQVTATSHSVVLSYDLMRLYSDLQVLVSLAWGD